MNRSTIAAALAATTFSTGSVLATTGSAAAAPADQPTTCTARELSISVTHDARASAGHEAFTLHYSAAKPGTHCVLRGTPTDVSFRQPSGDTAPGISATPDGRTASQVRIDSRHSGVSHLIGPTTGQENPVGTVAFTLPGGNAHSFVTANWPDVPVHGPEVRATPVTQV